MSRASGLHRLQEIDSDSDRLKGRLEEIRITLEDSSEIAQLKADLDARESVTGASSTAARHAENEVNDQRVKLQNTEQALYGGSVKNPKELEDLQMEEESLKRHLETLEDRYLAAMLEQEEAEKQQEEASASLDAAEGRQANQHAELISEREEINQRLGNLDTEREAAMASVSDEDLRTYEQLRTQLGGLAIIALNGDSCGACGLTLPASSRQLVSSGDDLVRCSQCSRILYGG
jgi:predicted  nucleic acid-binding Zn-ribbon protein